MEFKTERLYRHKARDGNMLEAKIAELHEIKEEIKRAKEEAMQSWLDSRPLIDELEKLKSGLENAKKQSTNPSIVISELESELEKTITSIRSKKEEELKIRKSTNKLNLATDRTHEEMEQIKAETDEEHRARSKLKQGLQMKRQSLRTLRLTLRAKRLESEAFGSSAAEALQHINRLQMDDTTVQLSHEDYNILTTRAKEESSLADWRVSVSMEQRLVAKQSRDSALRRLTELSSEKRLKRKEMNEEITGNGGFARDTEEEDMRGRNRNQVKNEQTAFTEGLANRQHPHKQLRISKSSNNKKIVKKKKKSILVRIRSFLVKKITKLFG